MQIYCMLRDPRDEALPSLSYDLKPYLSTLLSPLHFADWPIPASLFLSVTCSHQNIS